MFLLIWFKVVPGLKFLFDSLLPEVAFPCTKTSFFVGTFKDRLQMFSCDLRFRQYFSVSVYVKVYLQLNIMEDDCLVLNKDISRSYHDEIFI